MALQKFPVVVPLGGAVDEGTVTELVQPPRIQSADDCASVKGGAYQKRDSAEASDPDTGNPRGIAAAPFGVVGVTPDTTSVLNNGQWDTTPGNKGAQPGTVNPLEFAADEVQAVHTCDTAVIQTATGRVRCVVWQVGPVCIPQIEVDNTGGPPDRLFTQYPQVWAITIKQGADPLATQITGDQTNLNDQRTSYMMLVDDLTDAPITRPKPLTDFDSSMVDAPKVLPLDDGFLITAWDLGSADLLQPADGWYTGPGSINPPGTTIRNPAEKAILRIDEDGNQVALSTLTGGEIRDWVRAGDTVFACHARQTAGAQTTAVLYDLPTNAVSETSAFGNLVIDGVDGAAAGLVGCCRMTDDQVMAIGSNGASCRYTISTDTWLVQTPINSHGGLRALPMQSGGGALQGTLFNTTGVGPFNRAYNGVLPGSPSCIAVICAEAGGGYWVGLTTQGQAWSKLPQQARAVQSTEIVFEYWYIDSDGLYVDDTHNYVLGASPLSRAEADPDTGVPHVYLYAGCKVWPMPAPCYQPTGDAVPPAFQDPIAAASAFNGTAVLARTTTYGEGKVYEGPAFSDPPTGEFNSRYQLEAVYVADPLSVPPYTLLGNASNHRSALFTGGPNTYECTAPRTTAFGEGRSPFFRDYVTGSENGIDYTGVAITSACRTARISFTDAAPTVIDTGERVTTDGLYPIECDTPAAALGAGIPPVAALTGILVNVFPAPPDANTYSLGTVPYPVDASEDFYASCASAVVGVLYHPSGELIRSEPVFSSGAVNNGPDALGAPSGPGLSWNSQDTFVAGGPSADIYAGPWPLFGIPPGGTAAVEVYQSRQGDPYELVTTKIFSLEEGSVPYRNSRADPLRVGYWEGGELAPGPAPALLDVVSTNDRVFGLSAERPTLIYYTKIIRQGYALEWTRNFSIEFPEPLVAIAALPDGRLLGMSERAVYYTYGQGPSDTGQGAGFSVPQVLTLQTGCIAPPSIAAGDFGVIFRGPRGFYQVSRDLALKYVGLPYEDTTQTGTVVCTSIDAVRSEVHFYLEGGGAWIYNTLRGQWSSFTTGDAQDVQSATVANNRPMRWVADSATTGDIWTYSLDPAAAPALMSLQTGWLEMGRLQGFGRMWEVQIEGTREAATLSALRVEVFYDYDATPEEVFEYDDPGDHIKIRLRTARQKCESVSLRFSEYVPPGATDADCQGWNLSLCTLLAGVKAGLDKIATTEPSP